MTATTDHQDRRIRAYLRRAQQRDCPPTVGEMYDALLIPASSIRASLRRLTAAGEVKRAGEAGNGARTWMLTPME
jgi:predicted ArsR family transcriptional regulator